MLTRALRSVSVSRGHSARITGRNLLFDSCWLGRQGGGCWNTAAGKTNPRWRGGEHFGVARLQSSLATAAGAPDVAYSGSVPNVFLEVLPSEADASGLKDDPLTLTIARRLQRRVTLVPEWRLLVQGVLASWRRHGHGVSGGAVYPPQAVRAALVLGANVPVEALVQDINEDFVAQCGVSDDHHTAAECLRSVWLSLADDRKRLEEAEAKARRAEERAAAETVALEDMLGTQVPHINFVVHLQRRLADACAGSTGGDPPQSDDDECLELFGWLHDMHQAIVSREDPVSWWKQYFGLSVRGRQVPFFEDVEHSTLAKCSEDPVNAITFWDVHGQQHRVTVSVGEAEDLYTQHVGGNVQQTITDAGGSQGSEPKRRPSALRRVYLTRSGVGGQPAPEALKLGDDWGGCDAKGFKAGQAECVAVLAPMPLCSADSIDYSKDRDIYPIYASFATRGASLSANGVTFGGTQRNRQAYVEFAWTLPRVQIACEVMREMQLGGGLHIGGVHGTGKSTLLRALHAMIAVGGPGDVLHLKDMRTLWDGPFAGVLSLLQNSSGTLSELNNSAVSPRARRMLLHVGREATTRAGESQILQGVASLQKVLQYMIAQPAREHELRAFMCDEAAAAHKVFQENKDSFHELPSPDAVWRWDGIFTQRNTVAILASSPDGQHEKIPSLSRPTHPELHLPDPLHVAAILMASHMKEDKCPDLTFFEAAQVATRLCGNMRYCFRYMIARPAKGHAEALELVSTELRNTMMRRLEDRLASELKEHGPETEGRVASAEREKKAWRGGVAASMVMRKRFDSTPGNADTAEHFVGPLAVDSFLAVWRRYFSKPGIPTDPSGFEKHCIRRLVNVGGDRPLLQSLRRRLGGANLDNYSTLVNTDALAALNHGGVVRGSHRKSTGAAAVKNRHVLTVADMKWLGAAEVGERRVLEPPDSFPAADCIVHQVPEEGRHDVFFFQFTVSKHKDHEKVIGVDLEKLLLQPTAAFVHDAKSAPTQGSETSAAWWRFDADDGVMSRANGILAGMGAPVQLLPTKAASRTGNVRDMLAGVRQVDVDASSVADQVAKATVKPEGGAVAPALALQQGGSSEESSVYGAKPQGGNWSARVVYVSREATVLQDNTVAYDDFAPGIAFWATQEDLRAPRVTHE